MKITIQDLIDKNACKKGIKWFQENFGEETDIETLKKKLIEKKEWGYLWWVYEEFKLTGEYILFYPNGQVLEKCFYKNGKKDGEIIFYKRNGLISEISIYKKGIKIKCVKSYIITLKNLILKIKKFL